MRNIIVFFGLLFTALLGSNLQAQTINAATCNAADVQRALTAVAADGTTVVVPAGNCTWTSTVTYNQVYSLTIQGQTTCTGTPASACTDNTTITDGAGTNGFWAINTAPGKSLRLTGFTFAGGDPNESWGALRVNGRSQQLRIDHIHFNRVQQTALNVDGPFGVIDHVLADVVSEFVRPLNSSFAGVGTWGDNSFAQPTGFGTDQFLFLEDSTVTSTTHADNGISDCYRGGKLVVRHNTLQYTSVGQHGTGHAGEDRGCRAVEVYANAFQVPAGTTWEFNALFLAAGSAMMWGNSFPMTSPYYNHVVTAHINRQDNATYSQNNTPSGWGYCGTGVNGTGSAWDQSSSGYACLDQPGRGQGDLLSTGFPSRINTATGSISWPRQRLDPVYEWSDTWNCTGDSHCTFWSDSDAGTVQNRDYFLGYGNSSCAANPGGSCIAGVGVGTLANRPASCTANSVSYPAGNSPGVGYWATDTGTLYVCTSANSWTSYYKPYTYPHPLAQGGTSGGGTSGGGTPALNPPTAISLTIH